MEILSDGSRGTLSLSHVTEGVGYPSVWQEILIFPPTPKRLLPPGSTIFA